MTGPATPIVSALPGRLRLRHPLLRRPSRNRELADRIAALDGLRVAESSLAAGSLLVLYDPARVGRAAAEAHAAASAAAVLGTVAPPPQSPPESAPGDETAPSPAPAAAPAPAGGAGGQALSRRVNRAAKIGMMGSMIATIAALGVGKRLHAGAGVVFVALMLVHMTIQRKRLFQ